MTAQKLDPTVFTHKGVEIHMSPTGEFRASINGRAVFKPSLASMKKVIDAKDAFVPFEALVCRYTDDAPERVKVVGKRKTRDTRFAMGSHEWVMSDGRTTRRLYPLSSEKKLLAYRKLRLDTDAKIEKLRKEQTVFMASIPTMDATE